MKKNKSESQKIQRCRRKLCGHMTKTVNCDKVLMFYRYVVISINIQNEKNGMKMKKQLPEIEKAYKKSNAKQYERRWSSPY